MTLRPYQLAAVDAVYSHLREHDDNSCVVIPTAGGKTPVMATICRDAVGKWNGRVLILAHVRELLAQTVKRIADVAPEMWHQVGVYSAGLKARDTEHPVIVAGIQSVYRRACELGKFDLIIVDEAHMIPPDGDGMYRTFLAEAKVVNPNIRLIGLTATPFRMTSGAICGPENLLNSICYEVGVRELIVEGFLCPLKSKAGRDKADTSDLHVRGGEFVAGEVADLMDHDDLVRSACREIVENTTERRATLIFAAGIRHARHVQAAIKELGFECGFVCSETSAVERAATLDRFRSGKLPYLVNINVLTTGFDAPIIDCIAMLRPTMSPGLYYQMVGRGFRLCEGKDDCLVLDFGGNIVRHGPVDAIRISDRIKGQGDEAPAKECPKCRALVAAGYAFCPECGFEFLVSEHQSHDGKASTAKILSGEISIERLDVRDITYREHFKHNAPPDHPVSMRVEYQINWRRWVSEWICVEHTGYAHVKAEAWWRAHSLALMPETAQEAVSLAKAGALAKAISITVRSGGGMRYEQIVGHELGEMPDWREPGEEDADTADSNKSGALLAGYGHDMMDIPF